MKKIAAILLVIAALCVTILVALQIGANARRHAMESREPLSLKRLETLAATWQRNSQEEPTTATDTYPDEPSVKPMETASSELSAQEKTQEKTEEALETPHLKRTLTKAELVERSKGQLLRSRWREKVTFTICQQVATGFSAAGSSEAAGWYWEAAQEAESLHDWDTARDYYREALESSADDYVREWCCCSLAWLEEDPAVAERLLDLACESDSPQWIAEAIRLADATGSDALREYYLTRLRSMDTEWARMTLRGLEQTKGSAP